MGEAKRRAAEIAADKANDPWRFYRRGSISVTAVHEAGHAVGRFLTASLMGHQIEEAVSSVDMRDGPLPRSRGLVRIHSSIAATTYGPLWSKEIGEVSRHVNAELGVALAGTTLKLPEGMSSFDYLKRIIDAAHQAGCDIDAWFCAKVVHAIAGPAAEARITGKDFWSVMKSEECQSDYNEVGTYLHLVGDLDEHHDVMFDNAIDELGEHFHGPLWAAVMAVAAILPARGVVEGDACLVAYTESLARLEQ